MAQPDQLLHLLRRFAEEGVKYVLGLMHVRQISVEGVPIATLDIDGLLKTKTDYRDKDKIDIAVLTRLKRELG